MSPGHGAGAGEGRTEPRITGIVVHWRNEELLAELLAAWPWEDPRFELVVVDNSHTRPLPRGPEGARPLWVEPGRNLGFAGGVNAGAAAATGEALLLLNPDAHPEPDALPALLAGLAAYPRAAGLAPRLLGAGGSSQHHWQLGRLPGPWSLLGQVLGLPQGFPSRPAGDGEGEEPAPGTPVEQPAAAALLLRREVFTALGGLDESFYPAWFEDVDLAQRLARHLAQRPEARGSAGEEAAQALAAKGIVYWPQASFRHQLGASVPRLGYGPFLWIYNRNLCLYLRRHHGAIWAGMARCLLVPGTLLRIAQLPLRRPRRAGSRREAFFGSLAVLAGAISGFRLPAAYRRRYAADRRAAPIGGAPGRRG